MLTYHHDEVLFFVPYQTERVLMLVRKVTYFGEFGYLNSSCIRKSINLMFWSSSRGKIHAFVAKLIDRCFCWFPAAMLEPIRMATSMASPYKSL